MSAMFDDWAYQSVYEPSSPPPSPKKEQRRQRAVSIVRSVAHAPVVPAPELRPRARTIGTDQAAHSPVPAEEDGPAKSLDTPLTKDQTEKRWNRENWLGSLSPSTYDFDRQLWFSQVTPYRSARDEAELAGRLATEAQLNAKNLIREVDWLIHELRDTREHDLDPLRAASLRKRGLLEQQNTASHVRSAIATVWDAQYRIDRELRGPAPKAVPKLNQIMSDIDAGLAFCAEHPDFTGIEQAGTSLRTSAQRALAIANAYVSHGLMKVSNRINARVGESSGTGGTKQALIYTKFSSDVAKFQAAAALIRAHGTESQSDTPTHTANLGLQLFWVDTQHKYFSVRSSLINSDAAKYAEPLSQFTQLNEEFTDAARTAMVQFKQLYAAEKQVFESLFGPTTPEFWTWICDEVSDPLYSVMRRLIVHETDISKLGQLIILVHSETDKSIDAFADTSIQSASITESIADMKLGSQRESRLGGLGERSRYGGASRLASRSGSIFNESVNGTRDTSIANSNVSGSGNGNGNDHGSGNNMEDPFDIIYRDAQNRLMFRANLTVDELTRYEPTSKDMLRSRYPTVEKTLSLLGQVYQLLNSQVFNDLAHRCIRECLASLDSAVANKIASVSGEEAVKVHLFHIKQLLVLQSQIVDFDLQNTLIHEVDFSGIQRLLSRDSRGSSFRDLITLAWDSVPQVVEFMFDAMEELYASLRRSVDRMCGAFVSEVFKPLENGKPSTEFRDGLNREFKNLLTKVSESISDQEVTSFLVDSAQESVMDKYTDYYRSLSAEEVDNESLMDIDTMASWLSAMIAEL